MSNRKLPQTQQPGFDGKALGPKSPPPPAPPPRVDARVVVEHRQADSPNFNPWKMSKVWLVWHAKEDGTDLAGIYTTLPAADAACLDCAYCYSAVPVNVAAPLANTPMPGTVWPRRP